MRRYISGRTLLTVRIGTAVLVCTLVGAMTSSATTHGLSVSPVVDDILSMTKLAELNHNSRGNDSGTVDPPGSESRGSAMTSPSSNNYIPPDVNPVLVITPAITVEPMKELPSIERYVAQQIPFVDSQGTKNDATVSAAITPSKAEKSSMLQASNHGWKLFSIAWYWWLIAIGSGYWLIRHFACPRNQISRTMQ